MAFMAPSKDCHSLVHHHERLGRAPRASVAASAASVVVHDDDDDDDDDDSARDFKVGTPVTQLFDDGHGGEEGQALAPRASVAASAAPYIAASAAASVAAVDDDDDDGEVIELDGKIE
ncbi:hypothetical protein NFJ02_13g12890 [Pycnococcus provasolii]